MVKGRKEPALWCLWVSTVGILLPRPIQPMCTTAQNMSKGRTCTIGSGGLEGGPPGHITRWQNNRLGWFRGASPQHCPLLIKPAFNKVLLLVSMPRYFLPLPPLPWMLFPPSAFRLTVCQSNFTHWGFPILGPNSVFKYCSK